MQKKKCLWHITFYFINVFGQNTKHNGVQGLSKPYNIILDTKMGHGKSDMQQITCTCVACNSMLYKPWTPGVLQN